MEPLLKYLLMAVGELI